MKLLPLALLCGSLWGQATIPPSLEKHLLETDRAPVGKVYCAFGSYGTRERHAWVFKDQLFVSSYCISASVTRTKTGWRLELKNKSKIVMTERTDAQASEDSIMITEIVP